jgi:hypothetical protein
MRLQGWFIIFSMKSGKMYSAPAAWQKMQRQPARPGDRLAIEISSFFIVYFKDIY